MKNGRNYIYKWLAFIFLSLLCFANQDSISYYFDPISVLGKNQNNQNQSQVFTIAPSLLNIKSNNVTKANEQVPGLGNVPVIGNLLKYKKNEDNLEELLIFIAPRIL